MDGDVEPWRGGDRDRSGHDCVCLAGVGSSGAYIQRGRGRTWHIANDVHWRWSSVAENVLHHS